MPKEHSVKNRRSVVFAGIFMLFSVSTLFPCTLAVISGKATRNGRALMWKNRDTDKIDNKTLCIQGPKYAFIALVDRGTKRATKPGAAWVYESLKTAFPDIQ